MPALSSLVIGGLALSAIGTGVQVTSSFQQAEVQKDILEEQRKQEQVRKNAMVADSRRREMEVLRQSQKMRAVSLATANNQGAALGSGLAGAYGQASGQTGVNYGGIRDAAAFGNAIFDSNMNISGMQQNMAGYQAFGAAGAGLSSLGGAMVSSAGVLGRASQGFGGTYKSPWEGNMGGMSGITWYDNNNPAGNYW